MDVVGDDNTSLTVTAVTTSLVPLVLLAVILKMKQSVHPVLYHMDTPLSSYLLEHCKCLKEPFRPPFWLQNRHLQTLLPAFVNVFHRANIQFQREYINVDDGERIAVDWAVASSNDDLIEINDDSNIMIVLPGLTADSEGFKSTCLQCLRAGFRTGVMNKRGHGGALVSKPRLQGFGDGSDLHCVVKSIRHRYPSSKVGVIGSSAGSALFASYLGQYKEDSLVDVAVGISPGYEAEKLFTSPPFSRLYEFLMVKALKKKIIQPNSKCLSQVVDMKRVLSANSLKDIDEHLNTKMYGYKDLSEYWFHNDPNKVWGNFSTPVLCINSLDDPLCVAENIPFDMFKSYPNTMLLTTEKGGHCGFIEGMSKTIWADKVAIDYIKNVLAFLNK